MDRFGEELAAPAAKAVGSTTEPGRLAGSDQPKAVAALTRAWTAATRVAYVGERTITVFDQPHPAVLTVAVRHVPGQGITIEPGRDQETFIPAAGVAGAVGLGALDLLVDGYDVAITGVGQVAGRQASIVSASRQGVPEARFWLDQADRPAPSP